MNSRSKAVLAQAANGIRRPTTIRLMVIGMLTLGVSLSDLTTATTEAQPVAAPVKAEAPTGGVGIGLEPGPHGSQVVAVIVPGGPADKAHLTPGGRVVAIDQQPTNGLSQAEIVGKLRGPVGSQVTITLDMPTEIMDVILIRADVGRLVAPQQQQPERLQAQEPAGPMANNAPNGLPAFFAPGTRITYQCGNATLPSVPVGLRPDDKGGWSDCNGVSLSPTELAPASGGIGFSQLTIVGADAQTVAADRRDFQIVDVQNGTCQQSGAGAVIGDGGRLGDFWINPAELGRMTRMNQQGVLVQQLAYQLDGKQYDALSIRVQSQKSYSSQIYDLRTGMLLSSSTLDIGQTEFVPNPDGTASPARGTAQLSHRRIMSVRPTNLPWANDPLPHFLTEGQQLVFNGQETTGGIGGPGGGDFGANVANVLQIIGRAGNVVIARQSWGIASPGMPSQTANADRVLSSAVSNAIYINPQHFAALQPNATLDEDPITHYATVYVGQQNGMAVITERGAADGSQYGYDLHSGMLVNIISQKNLGGVGPQTTSLQLAR